MSLFTAKDDTRPLAPGEPGHVKTQDPFWLKYPPLIRVFAEKDEANFPKLSNRELIRALEAVFVPDEMRRKLGSMKSPPDGEETTWEFVKYVKRDMYGICRLLTYHNGKHKATKDLTHACDSVLGWRASTFLMAHVELPRTLIRDERVVLAQAFWQGLTIGAARALGYPRLSGELRKEAAWSFVMDPYIQLMLLGPVLPDVGYDFYGASFTHVVTRMRYLKENPYAATEGELDVIVGSPSWNRGMLNARMYYPRVAQPMDTLEIPGPKKGSHYYPLPTQRRDPRYDPLFKRVPKKREDFAKRT